jgi:hypothetical protein
VLILVSDPVGASLVQNDTSNVYVALDGNQVYYAGNSNIQFTVGSAPLLAEVRWTPQLSEGEHTVRYFARNAAGNSSDTTLLSVNVTNTLQLSEVYNIPNPFPNGTTFTFILAGQDNPQSVHIKIYTVAGTQVRATISIGTGGIETATKSPTAFISTGSLSAETGSRRPLRKSW